MDPKDSPDDMKTLLRIINFLLDAIADLGKKPARKHASKLWWIVKGSPTQPLILKGHNMLTLKNGFQFNLAFSAVDQDGNPAPVEGISWSSSNPAIASVLTNADRPSGAGVTEGLTGSAQIKLAVDPKIGPEVGGLMALFDVEVVPGEAVSLVLQAGTPQPIPTVEEPAE